ncbi:hypothetical protein [Arthrobacter pityocampae]|uniref:hypothetical protein n=1 Tax=Arthrobacter pityocampae TaxID=547334 RepID=UPI0019D4AA8C|nr:hypothetical protein [Arthrobacter pityocampae]
MFLFWASLSMIRQKWMYLLVGDAFMPGKPSLAMLPGGFWMATLPFSNILLDAPEPISSIFAFTNFGGLVFGLLGCFYVPRFLQPRWMKDSDDEIKRGEGLYANEYRRRVLGQGPDGTPLHPEERNAP